MPRPVRAVTRRTCRVGCETMALLPLALLAGPICGSWAPPRNPFGIGAYFPPGGGQIPVAAELVGRGGWVLILIPCGNVTDETPLPVKWQTFDPNAQIEDAYARGLNVVVRLEPQYSAMRPFSQCWNGPNGPASGPGGVVGNGTCPWVLPDGSEGCHQNTDCHLRRLADPESNFRSYKAVAASYARVAAALPLPPDGKSELYGECATADESRDRPRRSCVYTNAAFLLFPDSFATRGT